MAIPTMPHPRSADLRRCLAVFVLIITTSSLLRQPRHAGACVPRERDALLAFKRGVTNDTANLLASWQEGQLQDDCCRWRGVRCSNRTGHVLKLNLRNVRASSDGSYRDTALVGQISHSLLSLDHLLHLDLSMNYLEGSSGHIPEFLSSLTSLRYLNLSGIPFSGRVPPQLGNLSKLQYLDLSGFQGQFMYSTDISWLSRLPLLEYLSMSLVNLSTIVDWPYVVNTIPSLRVLNLWSCSLPRANQSLPNINLTKLERLDLSDNYFDHPMASCWFWNLTGLQHLYLASTPLYGEVPDALGDMTSLQVLDLSSNRNMTMMTTSLKNLCNLRILQLGWCYLYGNINEFIERIPQCPLNTLQELHLYMNNMTGTLPNWLGHLTSLVILDLSQNHLDGTNTTRGGAVGQLTSLSTLDLSSNNLIGPVPSEIGMLSNLRYGSIHSVDSQPFNEAHPMVIMAWTPPMFVSDV